MLPCMTYKGLRPPARKRTREQALTQGLDFFECEDKRNCYMLGQGSRLFNPIHTEQ